MTLLSNAVKIVDRITKGLQIQQDVTLLRYVKDEGTGDPQTKTERWPAVVERKQRQVPTQNGELVVSHTTVTFTNGTVSVGERDTIILSDNSGGQVVATSNPTDKSGRLITEAYLG